jgi:hypothetical protein
MKFSDPEVAGRLACREAHFAEEDMDRILKRLEEIGDGKVIIPAEHATVLRGQLARIAQKARDASVALSGVTQR